MSTLSSDSYSRSDARTAYEVEFAKVVSVRKVKLEGTQTGAGTIAGGVIGASGTDNVRGQVVGGVLGAILGSTIEESSTSKDGLEITVKMQTGKLLAVVQQDTGETFRAGDRVRVLRSGSEVRVSH
jgi:outer membrane lipoprotein SlyB